MISSRPALPVAAPEPVYSMPLPPTDEESGPGGVSPAQVIAILRAYRWHAVICVLALICLTAVIIKLVPKVYVATATLIINYDNKDALAGREFPAGDFLGFLCHLRRLVNVVQPQFDGVDHILNRENLLSRFQRCECPKRVHIIKTGFENADDAELVTNELEPERSQLALWRNDVDDAVQHHASASSQTRS